MKSGIQHEMLPLAYPKAYANYLRSAHVTFDPPDWSGGNTTIEALSYGVPVVTLPGPFMRGRHSLAFLQIANTQGLIAKDEDDFVDLIFDQDRHKEAMKNLNVDALYEDTAVVEALDAFLLSTASR
jgi:predicted O-linked N-acetylglucosamine transferase (SPINDLY family)